MAYLFVLENTIAKPNVETLLISPFKEIWDRDTTKDKTQAIKEFTYIELITSKKKSNPYSGYPENIIGTKIKEMLKLPDSWQPDELIKQGIEKVEEFNKEASPTYLVYRDALRTAEKTRKFLVDIDLSEVNERTGNKIYKPKDVTSALIDTEKIVQTLHSLREKVEQEMFDSVKTRGNKNINPLER